MREIATKMIEELEKGIKNLVRAKYPYSSSIEI